MTVEALKAALRPSGSEAKHCRLLSLVGGTSTLLEHHRIHRPLSCEELQRAAVVKLACKNEPAQSQFFLTKNISQCVASNKNKALDLSLQDELWHSGRDL